MANRLQRRIRKPKERYTEFLEKRVKELETVAAKFGCYEDNQALVCLHCPYPQCESRYTELLGEPMDRSKAVGREMESALRECILGDLP